MTCGPTNVKLESLTGAVVSLQVSAYDLDGDALTYSATNLPAGLSISASTGLISGTVSSSASTNSSYSVTVSAFDGTLSASQTFNWTVSNGQVTVTQPSDQTNTEGDVVSLHISASSTYGYPLTYSALGLPTGLSINASTGLISGTISTTAAEDVAGGLYTTTVTAKDTQGHSGSAAFNWSVADLHQTPTLTNPGSQTNAEGDAVSLRLEATSPTGASLTYAASGLPSGLIIDSFSGLISGTPGAPPPGATIAQIGAFLRPGSVQAIQNAIDQAGPAGVRSTVVINQYFRFGDDRTGLPSTNAGSAIIENSGFRLVEQAYRDDAGNYWIEVTRESEPNNGANGGTNATYTTQRVQVS